MILGIGVDLCDIGRMAKSVENERFLTRFFTDGEKTYIEGRGAAAGQSLAGIFAAKEAVLKALGTGLSGIRLTDIELTHDVRGAPRLRLWGAAKDRAAQMGVCRSHVSISHDGGMAVAMVVLED